MKSFFLSLVLLTPVSAQAASFVDVADDLSESYKFEQRHNYKDAVAVLAKAQKRQPDSYILNLRLGYLFLNSGITANALEHYTKAADAEPKSVEALLGLVNVYSAKARWSDVASVTEKILAISPDHYAASWNLIRADIMLGKFDDGLDTAKKMLKLYPTDQTLLVQKAVCLGYLKKNTEAKSAYHNVLAVYPNDPTAKAALELLK